APDQSVFYELYPDDLIGVSEDDLRVPASEVIHDRMNTFWHPLCGVSPLVACGLPALQGLTIQSTSARMFQHSSRPGGVITAPGGLPDAVAARIKTHWDTEYSGDKAGKVAVLGAGMQFSPVAFKAVDSQLVEQHKEIAIAVCSAFHVPPYKIGVGPMPT